MNKKTNDILRAQNELTLSIMELYPNFSQENAYSMAALSIPTVVKYFKGKEAIITEEKLERFFKICTRDDLNILAIEYKTSILALNLHSQYMDKAKALDEEIEGLKTINQL
jgi:hypothetical protein